MRAVSGESNRDSVALADQVGELDPEVREAGAIHAAPA